MEKPAPDPQKILTHWMEWEKGDTTPGDVMKNLKISGLRELLETLAGVQSPSEATGSKE